MQVARLKAESRSALGRNQLRQLRTQGWMPASSTLGAIDFGVEIVSTNSMDATFQFTDFSITSN